MLFGSKKPYDPATDVPDLTGQVMVVTGGKYNLKFLLYISPSPQEKDRTVYGDIDNFIRGTYWIFIRDIS